MQDTTNELLTKTENNKNKMCYSKRHASLMKRCKVIYFFMYNIFSVPAFHTSLACGHQSPKVSLFRLISQSQKSYVQ